MIYLASPYTHADPEVMESRARLVTIANAHLIRLGFPVYSPIAHCHQLSKIAKLPGDFDFWQSFDAQMIAKCDLLLVYTLAGWKHSKGVNAEIEIAREMKIEVARLKVVADWSAVIGMRVCDGLWKPIIRD